MSTAIKYLIIFFIVICLGLLGGMAYQYFYGKVEITQNSVIKNQGQLKQYLEIDDKNFFAKPLTYKDDDGKTTEIKSISVVPQKSLTRTLDCVSQTMYGPTVFCFEDLVKNREMIINIYPNQQAMQATDKENVDRLLNLSLFYIFEKRFGIDVQKKSEFMSGENFIFEW